MIQDETQMETTRNPFLQITRWNKTINILKFAQPAWRCGLLSRKFTRHGERMLFMNACQFLGIFLPFFSGCRSEFITDFLFLFDLINYHVNITSVLLLRGSLSRVISANKKNGQKLQDLHRGRRGFSGSLHLQSGLLISTCSRWQIRSYRLWPLQSILQELGLFQLGC